MNLRKQLIMSIKGKRSFSLDKYLFGKDVILCN